MKKIAKRVQELSQRAAQVAQAVEAMPARAAALREKVAATVEQAQQLRADLVSAVPPLPSSRSRAEVEIAASVREIEAAANVLGEAGYELAGAEVEPGMGGMGWRLQVLLTRVEAVRLADLRALADLHKESPVVKSLLSALVQAAETAEGIEFRSLDFTDVLVDVGAGRALRIGWQARAASAPAAALPAAVASDATRPPVFSQSNFFARPTAAAPASPPAASAGVESAAPAPVPAPDKPPAPAAPVPERRASALDRFKKMPDLSKRPG